MFKAKNLINEAPPSGGAFLRLRRMSFITILWCSTLTAIGKTQVAGISSDPICLVEQPAVPFRASGVHCILENKKVVILRQAQHDTMPGRMACGGFRASGVHGIYCNRGRHASIRRGGLSMTGKNGVILRQAQYDISHVVAFARITMTGQMASHFDRLSVTFFLQKFKHPRLGGNCPGPAP